MNRPIKFRAWDKIESKWLFGYDYPDLGGFSLLGEVVLLGELNSVPLERWNDVAIMQYTGLKDKNGVEIYEGDILSLPALPQPIHVVEWDRDGWYLVQPHLRDGARERFYGYHMDTIEIIGDVYENPELLDAKQEEGS